MDEQQRADENKRGEPSNTKWPHPAWKRLMNWRPSRRVLALTLAGLSCVFVILTAIELYANFQAACQAEAAQTAQSAAAQQRAVISDARGQISTGALQAQTDAVGQTMLTVPALSHQVKTTLQDGKSPALTKSLQAQLAEATQWSDLKPVDMALATAERNVAHVKDTSARVPRAMFVFPILALLTLILLAVTLVTDKQSPAKENPMPSASQLRTIRDEIRKHEVRISTAGPTAPEKKEIQACLLECQKLLDPVHFQIYSNDLTELEEERKDSSNVNTGRTNLASRCRPTLENIIAQVEDMLMLQEKHEAAQSGRSTSEIYQSTGAASDGRIRLGDAPQARRALPVAPSASSSSPSSAPSELEKLRQELKTLQGTLNQRDSQIQGKKGEIAALSQQVASFQEEQRGLQGQIDRLTEKVTTQDQVRREAEQGFQRQLEQMKAEAERKAGVAQQNYDALNQRHEAARQSLVDAEAKLQGRENAQLALEELTQASPTLPNELGDFVKDLGEIAAQIEKGDVSWVEKNLKMVDQAVYQSPPPSSRLSGRYPQFDEPIRLHQISLVQRGLHRQMERLGLRVIDPPADMPFDQRLHEAGEQDLVWVTSPDKDNQIASVVRLGFRLGDRVLRSATVKKHVYFQSGSRAGVSEAIAPVEAAPPEFTENKFLAELATEATTSGPVAEEERPTEWKGMPLPTPAPEAGPVPTQGDTMDGHAEEVVNEQVDTPPAADTPNPNTGTMADTPPNATPVEPFPTEAISDPNAVTSVVDEPQTAEPQPEREISSPATTPPPKERKLGSGSSLESKLDRIEPKKAQSD